MANKDVYIKLVSASYMQASALSSEATYLSEESASNSHDVCFCRSKRVKNQNTSEVGAPSRFLLGADP